MGGQQSGLEVWGRLNSLHLLHQSAQRFTQLFLLSQCLRTRLASSDVRQCDDTLIRIHDHQAALIAFWRARFIVARQIFCHHLKSFTVHAKHLAVATLSVVALSSRAGRIFSINNARARCSRERTVPTAQSRTVAASA
jgi:hypothetical protein